jgi:hypothetical protein
MEMAREDWLIWANIPKSWIEDCMRVFKQQDTLKEKIKKEKAKNF